MPRESQKDKRPIEIDRDWLVAQWELLDVHLLVLGVSELSVECLYHAVPLYLCETKVKRRYPASSVPRGSVFSQSHQTVMRSGLTS